MTDLATFLLVVLVGSYLLGTALTGLELLERFIRMIFRRLTARTKLALLVLLASAGACEAKSPTEVIPNCAAPLVMTREACQASADSAAAAAGKH
jgi:hypothetical protein